METTATATISQEPEERFEQLQPDSTTLVGGRTYIHTKSIPGLPSFPATFQPAGMDMDAYLPIDPDEAYNRGYNIGLNAWPTQAIPSTATTTHMQRWLNDNFTATNKRPAEEVPNHDRPHKRSVTRRSPPTDPRRHHNAPSARFITNNGRRDAATDADDILRHTAQFEKAAMIVRCCPIMSVDVHGPCPDDEDPRYFYLVIRNLRDCCLTTRELIIALVDRYAEPTELTFTRTGRDAFSAFLAFRTIEQLLKAAKHIPDTITKREVRTLLANSKYFPNAGETPQTINHYLGLNRLLRRVGHAV